MPKVLLTDSHSKLDELRRLVGDAKFEELLKRLSLELANRLDELEGGCLSLPDVAAASHKLVAIAGALGFDDLAACCQRLSYAARGASDTGDQLRRVAMAGANAKRILASVHG